MNLETLKSTQEQNLFYLAKSLVTTLTTHISITRTLNFSLQKKKKREH